MCIRDSPNGEATTGKLSFKLRIEEKARDIAEYCGFSQGMCYSFESPKVFDKLLIDKDDPLRQAVMIQNPLGEDFSICLLYTSTSSVALREPPLISRK